MRKVRTYENHGAVYTGVPEDAKKNRKRDKDQQTSKSTTDLRYDMAAKVFQFIDVILWLQYRVYITFDWMTGKTLVVLYCTSTDAYGEAAVLSVYSV